jgi:hypothetical protein
VPYDYDSVLHYGAYAFSFNGLPTITPMVSHISIFRYRPVCSDVAFVVIYWILKVNQNTNTGIQAPASQCEGLGSFPTPSLYGIWWLVAVGQIGSSISLICYQYQPTNALHSLICFQYQPTNALPSLIYFQYQPTNALPSLIYFQYQPTNYTLRSHIKHTGCLYLSCTCTCRYRK